MDGLGLDAVLDQIVVYKLIECGGHALALNILQSGDRGFVRCGETEGRSTKAERHVLERGGTGVLEQILAGDADVDGAAAHVYGDIERTQVEQLDAIVGILHNQLARVGAQTVAGLGQHVPRGFG